MSNNKCFALRDNTGVTLTNLVINPYLIPHFSHPKTLTGVLQDTHLCILHTFYNARSTPGTHLENLKICLINSSHVFDLILSLFNQ